MDGRVALPFDEAIQYPTWIGLPLPNSGELAVIVEPETVTLMLEDSVGLVQLVDGVLSTPPNADRSFSHLSANV